LTIFGRALNSVISAVFNRAGTSVLNSASSSTLVAVSRTATTATLQNADLFLLQSRSSNLTLKATGTFFVVAGRTQNHLVGI
jgi:hypothetical protein